MLQVTLDGLGDESGLARLITNNTVDAIFLMDRNGCTLFANPAAERLFGWSQNELLGRKLHDVVHHHHPDGTPFPMSECALGEVFATGRSLKAHEDVFFHRDGRQIPVSCSNAAVTRNSEVIAGVLVVQDITERKLLEEQRELMRGELAHRIKNLISVIQALALQSLKGEDLAAARDAFLGRLKAVADAQLLLGDDQATAVTIGDLAFSTLAPFQSEQQPALISGPPVLLPPKQALTLTMAIHELATNAVKYGALSVPSGRVSITWRCTREAGEETLSLWWKESGGPPVEAPATKGFGTRMIKRALAAEFDGSVELIYDRDGLKCHLTGRVPETNVS